MISCITAAGVMRMLALSLFILLIIEHGSAQSASSNSVVYGYDAAGRLVSASYDNGVIILYTYDANGNRTQQVINANTASGVWGSFNWGAALFEPSGPTVWDNFNWDQSPWS